MVLQCCCSPFPVLSNNLGVWLFYLHWYFRVLSLYYRECLSLPLLLLFVHFSLTCSSFLVRHPSVCMLNDFSPLLFSFIPPKPEGVEKETVRNSVLCLKGKALPPCPPFVSVWVMSGTCLEEEDSAASTAFRVGWYFTNIILQVVIRGNETRCRSLSKLPCYSNCFRTYSRQMLLGESYMNG